MSNQFICLQFTVTDFNLNHAIKFFSFDEKSFFLFDVSSVARDDSIYVTPLFSKPVITMRSDGSGINSRISENPSTKIRLSFHETGAVNLHVDGDSKRVRSRKAGRVPSGLITRLVFRSLDVFHEASIDEINSLPKRYTPIPVTGIVSLSPVCVDIYQVEESAEWIMPKLSDMIQIDACVKPSRKNWVYHFIIWQNNKVESIEADFAIYYMPN